MEIGPELTLILTLAAGGLVCFVIYKLVRKWRGLEP